MRFLLKLILCLILALAAGFGYLALRSGDALYSFYEWVSPARFQQYDKLILSVAAEHQLDPMLVKAVVWRESWFNPEARGSRQELGLMQIRGAAAQEWAQSEKLKTFSPQQLLDPGTNTLAGAWYLAKLLKRHQQTDNPLPYALADYNAGRTRALKWDKGAAATNSAAFLERIDFPGTRKYVRTVLRRYEQYRPVFPEENR